MFNIGFYGGTYTDKLLLITFLKNNKFNITTNSHKKCDFIFMIINTDDDQKLEEMYDNCVNIMKTMDPSNMGIIHSYDICYTLKYNKEKYSNILLEKFTEYKFDKTDIKILYFPFNYDYDSFNEISKKRHDNITKILVTDIIDIIKQKKKPNENKLNYNYNPCWIM